MSSAISASQVAVTLKTTTFPCTIAGLRWAISANGQSTAAVTNFNWAIVVVRDGLAASAISTSDGSDFYTPEQDVLAFGVRRFPDADSGGGPNTQHWEGNTKTMRKLKSGDLLQFIQLGSAAAQGSVIGCIQFFCKS